MKKRKKKKNKYPEYGIVIWWDVSSTVKSSQYFHSKNDLCLKRTVGKLTFTPKEKMLEIECEVALSEGFMDDQNYKVGMPFGNIKEIIPLKIGR